MEYKIQTIGVLTSGGDAPGMNAAVRAVTRAALANNIRVKAVFRGYKGLMDDEVQEFTTQDVSGIIQRGGTILKSARSEEFKTPEGRKRAYDTIRKELTPSSSSAVTALSPVRGSSRRSITSP